MKRRLCVVLFLLELFSFNAVQASPRLDFQDGHEISIQAKTKCIRFATYPPEIYQGMKLRGAVKIAEKVYMGYYSAIN